MRTFWTIVVLTVIVAVLSPLLSISFWLMVVVDALFVGLFIYNGLNKIPADPPHKAVLMFLGERQGIVLYEGWNFFPLYPFVFSFVLVKVEKVNYDIKRQEVRTPDRALISMEASITWIPGIGGRPDSYITYLNSGGEEGVKKIIKDVIEDRTKTWASSNREGPSTWEEAQALKDDAHEVLVKSLLGKKPEGALEPVGNPIPTNTWMRFFDTPQSEPTSYDCARRPGQPQWASKDYATGDWNWDGLQVIYDGYPTAERTELRDRVEQRRKDVRAIREGKGVFGHESLGITIVRFTVNELKVEGEVAKAAELAEKERKEREAETIELRNVSDRIGELMGKHPGLSIQEAIRLVQTERGKISKSVIEVLGASTGLGQDFLGALGFQRLPGGSQQNPPSPGGGGSGSGPSSPTPGML